MGFVVTSPQTSHLNSRSVVTRINRTCFVPLLQRSHLGSRKSPTKKVLTTEHKDYVVNARQSKEARAIIPMATIP
jgi:hypothetical protein